MRIEINFNLLYFSTPQDGKCSRSLSRFVQPGPLHQLDYPSRWWQCYTLLYPFTSHLPPSLSPSHPLPPTYKRSWPHKDDIEFFRPNNCIDDLPTNANFSHLLTSDADTYYSTTVAYPYLLPSLLSFSISSLNLLLLFFDNLARTANAIIFVLQVWMMWELESSVWTTSSSQPVCEKKKNKNKNKKNKTSQKAPLTIKTAAPAIPTNLRLSPVAYTQRKQCKLSHNYHNISF